MKKILNTGYWLVLLFYLYLLIDIVFFARDVRRSINLTPFNMIVEQGFTLNVWGNVLMFIPLGLYFADFMKKFNLWKILFYIIGISLFIEVTQYVLKRGTSDIDDLILNTVGGLIGIMFYLLIKTIFKNQERVHNAVSILSLVVGIPIVLLTILLFVYN